MEHSALHALQLIGMIAALGGPILVLLLCGPARRAHPVDVDFLRRFHDCQISWVARGALLAAVAALCDLFVQTAEIEGKTVFGGIALEQVIRFATQTTVGNIVLMRVTLLFLTALAARSVARVGWSSVALSALAAIVCAGLVSHAAAQPTGRVIAVATQIAHLTAAAAWMGVLMHLLGARRVIESSTTPAQVAFIADVVRRFSPVALTAAALLAASGAMTLLRYLSTPSDLFASPYGLTLLVKLVLMAPLLAAAAINFRSVRPALLALEGSASALPGIAKQCPPPVIDVLQRFGRTLELEVTAGILVITVAGIVGSISPPSADGAQRLNDQQIAAMQRPVLPPTTLIDPSSFVGADERTIDDLRYSELMHRWSGVFVVAMGLVWLGQSLGGQWARWATQVWPLLLLPFAVFISVFADADVFLVPKLTFWEAISSPSILEHQLGALMILILAWLGWRDRARPERDRPMGRTLPIVMMLGSLLLLGHAHSALSATEELTNLINVQHAVLGAFGLLAGTLRWLSLRELIPARWGNRAWPVLVIGLGSFMAFCYRETL